MKAFHDIYRKMKLFKCFTTKKTTEESLSDNREGSNFCSLCFLFSCFLGCLDFVRTLKTPIFIADHRGLVSVMAITSDSDTRIESSENVGSIPTLAFCFAVVRESRPPNQMAVFVPLQSKRRSTLRSVT